MISMMSIQIKVAIFVIIGLIAGYLSYDVFIKPQKQIIKLEKQLVEQKQVPAKVVKKINKADANRTQEEIDAIEVKATPTLGKRGIIIFK